MFDCSVTQIHDPEVREEGSYVSLETTIESHDLVYYLGLEPLTKDVNFSLIS